MPLTTITLSGPLITQANGSITPALPTNDIKKQDLPIPQGYDNDYNYEPPAFHLALILGLAIPLSIWLIGCAGLAVWACRWNRKVDKELEESEREDGVTVDSPLATSENHSSLPSSTMSPPPVTIPDETGPPPSSSHAEEIPHAALLKGRFEPSEDNLQLNGLYDIPGRACDVYAVCGRNSKRPSHCFIALHFVLDRPVGEIYPAHRHLLLRYLDADQLLLRTTPMGTLEHIPSPRKSFFSFRFYDDPTNPSASPAGTQPETTQYTLDPDPANSQATLPDRLPTHQNPDAFLIADTVSISASPPRFKLMFWGALPESDLNTEHLATKHPIELGTITLNQHYAFYPTRAPSPGVSSFDYNTLIRNIETVNTGLGFNIRLHNSGNGIGNYGEWTEHGGPAPEFSSATYRGNWALTPLSALAYWKIRDPVRSPIDKLVTARLVVGWVTTSESLVLYVFFW